MESAEKSFCDMARAFIALEFDLCAFRLATIDSNDPVVQVIAAGAAVRYAQLAESARDESLRMTTGDLAAEAERVRGLVSVLNSESTERV